MSDKHKLSATQWTSFWKRLGVHPIERRTGFLKNYTARQKDFPALKKKGVNQDAIEIVYKILIKYNDRLQFHNFSRFFRKDPSTVSNWLNASDASEAFLKLFRLFQRNNIENLRKKFGELTLLYKLNKKGEGRNYITQYHRQGSVRDIDGSKFTRILNRQLHDERFRYLPAGTVRTNKGSILHILRKGADKKVDKFISLERTVSDINIKISADSSKEYLLIRKALGDIFKSFIDTPQFNGNFKKIISFLKSGSSKHFTLIGVDYYQDEFKVSVTPKYGRPINISAYPPYKRRLEKESQPETSLIRIHVIHEKIGAGSKIAIDIISHNNGDVIGAVLYSLNDRNLNSDERKSIKSDFLSDFGLPLNTFIDHRDLSDKDIYRKLLETVPMHTAEIDLRSADAISIYSTLEGANIFKTTLKSHEPKYCVNSDCRQYYRRAWSDSKCNNCGGPLISGKKIFIRTLNEDKLSDFIHRGFNDNNLSSQRYKKQVLGRTLHITNIVINGTGYNIIPITTPISTNIFEMLFVRYPHALYLSSQSDLTEWDIRELESQRLHEFIYNLFHNYSAIISKLSHIDTNARLRQKQLSKVSASRITDNEFYINKNHQGPELYEADCAALLGYIFGNSLWLGTTKRGKPVPDGLAAFPMTGKNNGCFIWDSKFTEGGKINCGSLMKNRTYISDALKNDKVKNNGGLKGFLFIGNITAPNDFIKKYKNMVRNRKLKISYVQSKHLLSLYNHFKKNEGRIENNARIKKVFIDAMMKIFFVYTKSNRAFVLDDSTLRSILRNATQKYNEIDSGTRLER